MIILGRCEHQYEGNHTYSGFCPECESKLFGFFATLSGSEKQVSWANDIRQSQLRDLVSTVLIRVKTVDAIPAQGLTALHKLAAITEAKFWIDNRNSDSNALLKAIR